MTFPLSITARCRVDGCPLDGDDVFIVVTITNQSASPQQTPLAFLQQSGPAIELIDHRTGATTYLRKPPADLTLLRQPITLGPGASASLDWVIHTSELATWGRPFDVTAKIILAPEVGIGDQPSRATRTATIRFTGG